MGDVILHYMFVQWVGDLQHADECENKDILAIVVYFGQLTLKVANVHLETVRGSHHDGEEEVVVLLELLKGGVLQEEQLGEILKVMD